MNVADLGITWSHTYTSDDIVEVPGFTASLPGIFSAGVYVQVGITNNDNTNQLRLKVSTSCKVHCAVLIRQYTYAKGMKVYEQRCKPIHATLGERSKSWVYDLCKLILNEKMSHAPMKLSLFSPPGHVFF